MDLKEFATTELKKIPLDKDGTQQMINGKIMEIVEKFSDQDHSGASAVYSLEIINRLLRFKPVTSLTGEGNEWMEVEDGNGLLQNKRCFSVFRERDGKSYDVDSVVLSEDGGLSWFHPQALDMPIEFPYYPPASPEEICVKIVDDSYVEVTDMDELREIRRTAEEKNNQKEATEESNEIQADQAD